MTDCKLYLLATEWGRLSSRDLPAAQTCVVELPQRRRARLVVDLTKLNVPCKRGRLQVSGHQPVCGKLEDLRESDRHYVLDADRSAPNAVTSSVGRYAFAFTYRLAASCFDNDVAQQNGTVVFTPGSECRYKVTQPYGYRLRLLISSVPYPTARNPTYPATAAVAGADHATTATAKPMTVSDNIHLFYFVLSMYKRFCTAQVQFGDNTFNDKKLYEHNIKRYFQSIALPICGS